MIDVPSPGPEDVINDGAGKLLVGCENGDIYRVDPTSGESVVLANTGGRPLGLELVDQQHLIVCDSYRGLLKVDLDTGEVAVLVSEVDGRPLRFCSNAVVEPDGTVWFTESTSNFHYRDFMGAILENVPTGRLMRRNPDATVDVVLTDLFFANGLAIEPSGDSLLLCETTAYRVKRHWIRGERAGETEVLLDNLPGFPDNMSAFGSSNVVSAYQGNEQGVWVAYAHPRSWALDLLAALPRRLGDVLAQCVWSLPEGLQPQPKHDLWIVRIEQGKIAAQIRAHHPALHTATAAVEIDGTVYVVSKDHGVIVAIPA